MKKEMLINVLQPEECRIAIVEDGVLEELYVERTSHESYVGNIYKGRIVNIEPSIQAAFVDFGVGRNGFLHVSDVEPAYYRHRESHRNEGGARGRDRYRGGSSRPEGRGRRGSRPRTDEGPNEGPEGLPPAEPEARDELESSPPRRSGGRSRRPRKGTSDREERSWGEATPSGFSAEPTDESPWGMPPADAGEGAPSEEDEPRPRPMDSAERRTEEGDDPVPSVGGSSVPDDDLFFPRAEPPREESEGYRTEGEYPEPEVREAPERSSVEPRDDFTPGEFEEPDWETESQPGPGRVEVNLDEEPRQRRRPPDRGGRGGRRGPGRLAPARPKPLIQDIFRRGQEVLVQVIK